jgi:acetylornithine deacetylase (EC 3.5.1.16)/N2-acetyl-L-lysine deacetylase (EC 3.5.1.-)
MRLGKESVLSLVKEVLLKLSSVYTPSGEELNAKDVMLQISKELDLPLHIDETGSYYLGSQESKVLLASHIDTVPGFVQPKDEGSAISGRGVVDAKGPLSAMIVASHLLKGDGLRRARCGAFGRGEVKRWGQSAGQEGEAVQPRHRRRTDQYLWHSR